MLETVLVCLSYVLLRTDQVFQVCLRCAHIFHLLGPGDFALDGNRAAIVDFFQSGNDTREINFAFAYRNLFPESFRIGGPETIFGMNSLNIGTKQFDCVYRIGFAVQNQVGEIEIYTLIVGSNILNRAHERDRSFLAGLVTQVLAVAFAILGCVADSFDGFLIQGIVGIFGNESAMSLDSGNAALPGKIGGLLNVSDSRGTRLARNQTDSERATVKIPDFLTWPTNYNGRRLDVIHFQRLPEPAMKPRMKVRNIHLCSGKTEIANLYHCRIGIVLDRDNQA